MKSIIIPRNIFNYKDKYPIDFILNVDVELRQIPYILSGACLGVLNYLYINFPLLLKLSSSMIILSILIFLSNIKIKGENFESHFINIIKYNYFKIKYRKEINNG